MELAILRSHVLGLLQALKRSKYRWPTAAFLSAVVLVVRCLRRRSWCHAQKHLRRSRPWLKCTSHLPGSAVKHYWPHFHRRSESSGSQPDCQSWRGSCPCCRRPLDIEMCASPPRPEILPGAVRGKYAYVITLWGASKSYVLGALVLGHSIRATGTPHALVCLHTDDVPVPFIDLLSRIWDCRLIKHVEASKALSWSEQVDRFEHVFTKLQGLQLVEFEKIVMMDIDMLVLKNVDDLFKLSAPAAMKRGNGATLWGLRHGSAIDGRPFFSGAGAGKYSWGQGTGINAGVMLWQPNKKVHADVLAEVAEPNHPAHIRSNGPEQDFLSRYWADAPWTAVGVEYNFQLHQMFLALNPHFVNTGDRSKFLRDPHSIKIVHYSGEPLAKPWNRVLKQKFKNLWPDRGLDADYTKLFAEEFRGWWLWVKRDRSAWDRIDEQRAYGNSPMDDFSLGEDGEIYRLPRPSKDGSGVANSSGNDSVEKPTVEKLPENAVKGAMELLDYSLKSWFDAFESLQSKLGIDIVAALDEGVPKSDQAASKEGENDDDDQTWKATWFAKPKEVSQIPTPARATHPRTGSSARIKYRRMGGWTQEEIQGHATGKHVASEPAGTESVDQRRTVKMSKASVVCGSRCGERFVAFSEPDGMEHIFPEPDDLPGIFVKIVGRGSRTIAIEDGDVSPVSIWAEGVEDCDVVLLAMIDLEPELLQKVLVALKPLGIPQGPIPPENCVLATAGSPSAIWDNAHASADIAYASAPVPIYTVGDDSTQ